MAGLFITLEGGDGSGKTTQAALLEEWLGEQGRRVVRTREPGGTDLGLELRQIVLHRRGHIAPRAEALLYAADRAHHVETLVRPALDRGEVVLQDRYVDSSVAYQGAGRVLGGDEVRELSVWATGGLTPDLTVLLDLDPQVGRSRLDAAEKSWDRLESEAAAFHGRVRDAYLAIARAEPARFLVVDATLPVAEAAAAVRARVADLLAEQ
ncbi:dTMP kinase [uncultured Frigoribacterium sp.]|uniref:dTMP kinase n=1 Tax=uncultured Frigoribacterium sp. TaxID=335377 RepID=UPI0028D5C082|nr:dTMP kinase [uncultured Frigoribacterium sp.]